MENNITADRGHSLNYADKQINISGVKEVLSFEEREVTLKLETQGMTIKGSGLTVAELNLKNGILKIDGLPETISYSRSHEKMGLAKRLFK